MKILFLCTAHNSLSQRLPLVLSRTHSISIEYALSDDVMLSAVALAAPDLIICPFLTTLVPKEIYEKYMTLIIHPGPPGDAGASSLDWLLMGDDGHSDNAELLLMKLDASQCRPGRTYWGVTVLQAIAEFDAGPVWAFDQFPIDIDQTALSKGSLYRGSVSSAAVNATLAAINRIEAVAWEVSMDATRTDLGISPSLLANPKYRVQCVSHQMPFQGGPTHHRPFLKAGVRDFDLGRHTSQQISRRLRSADSQPGVLSSIFGVKLFLYGGLVDENVRKRRPSSIGKLNLPVLGIRNQAICIATCDGKGVWITHIRQPKTKGQDALMPKVPAVSGLKALRILQADALSRLVWQLDEPWKYCPSTYQEVWVDFDQSLKNRTTAYLHFDVYNGAMGTEQCHQMLEAMDFISSRSTIEFPIQAVVLMSGQYFSNGIALNIIEAADDPATESWLNINAIDDVVQYILEKFPAQGITTVAAVQGNAAAGGVALAAACDIVIAGENVVLNPAYRAIGLYGSEYHTITYAGRCGSTHATALLRSMTPISATHANSIGLVDHVLPGSKEVLERSIRARVSELLDSSPPGLGSWKKSVPCNPTNLAHARVLELREMSLDFWSPRAVRYHSRRSDFVRKVKPSRTPLRFATHRRTKDRVGKVGADDIEALDLFDDVRYYRLCAEQDLLAKLRRSLMDNCGRPSEVPSEVAASDAFDELRHRITDAAQFKGSDGDRSVAGRLPKKQETLFDCHYRPQGFGLPLTPPESSLEEEQKVLQS